MKYNPLVSIIIPVYNGSNYLKEAIDSALAQTYQNIEIIVINDGSSDGGETENIALSYGNRINYIRKENGGVSSALNVGINIAHGEWISWLSHDDLYFPNKIQRQIDFVGSLLNDDPSINIDKTVVHTATISIDADGKTIKKPNYKDIDITEDARKIAIDNIYNYRLSGCSFLIPKKAFTDVGGFREDIRTVSDVEYWYRLLFNGYQFYCLKDDILVKNRSHGKQVGKVKAELFETELNNLYIELFDIFNKVFKPSNKEIECFYFALVYRGIKNAAKVIKQNNLRKHIGFFSYYLKLPLISILWSIKRGLRTIVKFFYRKIFVK